MGWIEQEYTDRINSRQDDLSETAREQAFEQAELQRWQQLTQDLNADVAEYNRQGGSATLTHVSETEIRITDRDSALTLTVRADIDGHTIHYDYGSTNSRVASPEGGIFAFRRSRWGRPELYSADQRIHNEGARRMLLEPILFPPDVAA
jgi:hypothetical protein